MQSYYETTFAKTSFGETEESLLNIVQNIEQAKQNYFVHQGELQQWLISEYLREVWISETPPDKSLNTVEIVDDLVEGHDKPDGLSTDDWQKLNNLMDALRVVINRPFNIDLARDIHKIIGQNLIANAGEYRTKCVMAQGSHVFYATPASIPARLESLFQFVERTAAAAGTQENKCLFMIRLAAFFFSEFLLIHPFLDGNGRTARLLLNSLLAETVVIPFSLFHEKREKMLDALEKRNNYSPPSDLANLVLLACNKTASAINWLVLV